MAPFFDPQTKIHSTITPRLTITSNTQWRHLRISAQESPVDEKIIAARPLEATSAAVMAAVADIEPPSDRLLENQMSSTASWHHPPPPAAVPLPFLNI